MVRLSCLFALAAAFALAGCGAHDPVHVDEHAAHDHAGHAAPDSMPTTQPGAALPNDGTRAVGDITTCPVSNKTFTVAADSPRAEHDGGTYYFCCGGCVDKFTADPASFLAPGSEPATMSDAEVLPNDGTRQVGDITRCPSSGNVFTVEADSPKYEHDGKTVWFCCAGCIDKYKETL